MSELDIEGVLAGHRAGSTTFCTGCDWRPEDGRSEAVLVNPAHVAAVLREQIAAAQAEAWDEALFAVCVDNGIVYDIGMRPTNPYRAALVAPSRVPGECDNYLPPLTCLTAPSSESGRCNRCAARVPGEET